jgi:HD superfamily phosphohydrolase YqeK
MTGSVSLPPWAQVGEKRRQHIQRVTTLLEQWAQQLELSPEEAAAWRDAGLWHDSLRDASAEELYRWAPQRDLPAAVLHGFAAAERLAFEGETRDCVLQAIRWHTLGHPDWERTGRALFMADFLEPGRPFLREDRGFLAAHVVHDFDGVFRQVLRLRLEWMLREGKPLFPETTALWNRWLAGG